MSTSVSRFNGRLLSAAVCMATFAFASVAAGQSCVGDCNNDATVTIDELTVMVNIALENPGFSIADCQSGDANGDGVITIDEITSAVNSALENPGFICVAGPTGWIFENPAPTGDDLYSISFADADNGWAVGVFADIEHTSDGGLHWAPQVVDSLEDFLAVEFVGPQTGWIVGTAGAIFHTADGGTTWTPQTSNTLSALSSVSFLSDGIHGWAVGEVDSGTQMGTILHTDDGGANWSAQTSNSARALNWVSFVDADFGWAVGESGTIVHTEDGGATWVLQNSTTVRSLYGLTFLNRDLGFAVGDEGFILRTTDGGGTWTANQIGTIPLSAVAFADATHGWVVGDTDDSRGEGTILHTVDGGQTWTPQHSLTSNTLFAVAVFDSQVAWAAGGGGTLLNTRDGETWQFQNPATTNELFGLVFPVVDPTKGFAVGTFGAIAYSEDAGENWQARPSGTEVDLFAVTSIDPQSVWVAGQSGTVLHSADGGTNWQTQNTNTTASLLAIKTTNGLSVWAVGDLGTIVHTADGRSQDAVWEPQVSNTGQALFGLSIVDTSGWAVGDGGTILHTENGGATWQVQRVGSLQSCTSTTANCPSGEVCVDTAVEAPCAANSPSCICRVVEPLYAVTCVDADTCWAVGGTPDASTPTQVILHTENRGATWIPQTNSDSADALFAVTAIDKQRAWAVGDYGLILVTTNGGAIWTSEESFGFDPLNAVTFIGPQTGFIAGDRGTILKTITGGE
jgi:photosystem II stability/assembly factor-like uncharacterized protein